ncbi:hypothetical protein M8C21_010368, partial [Ambrosia artemisiifolia]
FYINPTALCLYKPSPQPPITTSSKHPPPPRRSQPPSLTSSSQMAVLGRFRGVRRRAGQLTTVRNPLSLHRLLQLMTKKEKQERPNPKLQTKFRDAVKMLGLCVVGLQSMERVVTASPDTSCEGPMQERECDVGSKAHKRTMAPKRVSQIRPGDHPTEPLEFRVLRRWIRYAKKILIDVIARQAFNGEAGNIQFGLQCDSLLMWSRLKGYRKQSKWLQHRQGSGTTLCSKCMLTDYYIYAAKYVLHDAPAATRGGLILVRHY